MPRTVNSLLRQMYERANPNVCEFVEIAQPDVGKVLRRWEDQFSVNPPRLSETPASTTQKSPGGGIMLKATPSQLVNLFTASATTIGLQVPDISRVIRGVAWQVPPTLKPVRLKKVRVRLHVSEVQVSAHELQIYRMRGIPGRIVNSTTGAVQNQLTQWIPTPLLSRPARVNIGAITAPNDFTLEFNLEAYEIDIEHRNVPAPSVTSVGELPEYIFEVSLTGFKANNKYQWYEDTTSSRALAVGTFADVEWNRANPDDPSSPWIRTEHTGQVPCIQIDVDTYPATSQEVYAITLPRVPITGSTGRVVFKREDPAPLSDGGSTLELSTTSSSSGFATVVDGDVIATKQQNYWLRATLNASADTFRSPIIEAAGIEFRTTVDVSVEATVVPVSQDINLPFLESSIGEGSARIVRTGRRDYRDPASDVLTAAAATQLEVDHYLGSRHPKVTRDLWLHLGRYLVTAAQPTSTSEILSLISYLKILKKKIPRRVESVNAVLTVVTSTKTAITVASLPGTSLGDEYDGLNYYIRILSTSVVGLAPGMPFDVAGNTGTTQLDLVSPGLPVALAVGDTFELHSGTYLQPKLAWVNADPADVWEEIETTWLGVPPERIGRADIGRVGRAGKPPKLADRASDTATQNKLRVSRSITEQDDAKKLIDELSCIMQGTTLEIGGQICFRPIYDLLDPTGALVMPPEEVAATFDVRDIATLDTPRGLESRITTIACTYGVDTALGDDAAKPSTVVYSDGIAEDWYTQQDIEEIGNSQIPDGVAAWCYNTYDGGLYLASLLCQQVVRACSTGLHQWSWTTVDAHPELVVGDRVVVITDQYVDFDPTTKVAIRGWWAYTLVLVHVGRGGREFRGFMLGLSTATEARGGSGGVSTGSVGQPSIANTQFDAAGNLLVSLNMGNPAGGGFRVAASSSVLPTDATVDATAFVPGQSATLNLGVIGSAGATVYVKAFAYASSDTAGARSLASTTQVKVAGGSSSNTFTSAAQGTPNFAANTIPLNWVWGGATATFNVWVSELGSAFAIPTGGSGVSASPYTYHTSEDIVTGTVGDHGNTNDTIIFYVEAVIGGVVVGTSAHISVTYRAQI